MSGCAKNYILKKDQSKRYTTTLEQYDFVPYFNIKNKNKRFILHTEAGKYLFFFMAYSLTPEEYKNCLELWRSKNIDGKLVIITFEPLDLGPEQFYDKCLVFKFGIKKKGDSKLFLVNRNLKIEKVYNNIQEIHSPNFLKEFSLIKEKNNTVQSPVYIIQDVITEELRLKLLKYWEDNKHSTTDTHSKHRIDAYPSKQLEYELDNKLTKSLLPEVKKVYHIDVTHRENYKICCYDSAHKGRFHAHRDTPHPYSHRRYALVLALNDEFGGGGLRVKEYGDTIYKAPPRAAIIFPCMTYHEVVPITEGRRFAIISFLLSEDEVAAKEKHGVKTCVQDMTRYRFKTERDQYNINLSYIYPLSQ